MILYQGRKNNFQTPQKKVASFEKKTSGKEEEKKQDQLGNKGKQVEVKNTNKILVSFNLDK